MLRNRIGLLAIVALSIAVGVLQAPHATGSSHVASCDRVASALGSDAAAGTLASPYRTAQKLVDQLAPGQTGCLRGTTALHGPFAEDVTITTGGGSESTRVTVRSYPGEVAELRGRLVIADTAAFVTVSGLVLDGTNPADLPSPTLAGDYALFADNNVRAEGSVDCFRIGTQARAAQFATLLRNRIHGCATGVDVAFAASIQAGDNLIYDNGGAGVRLGPDARGSWLHQNVFDGNAQGVVFSGGSAQASTSNLVSGNVIGNSTAGWNVSATWPGPVGAVNWVWRNCLSSASAPPQYQQFGGIQSPASGFRSISPSEFADPQFQDPAANDFTIPETSPCFPYSGDVGGRVEAAGGPNDEQADTGQTRPNVLFIITDDQRLDGTVIDSVMPATRQRFFEQGTSFPQAVVTTPLCCPSRASIFSGRYVHNHNVKANTVLELSNFNENLTIQRYLNDAGYFTGLVGKILNGWDFATPRNPLHFDRWNIVNNGYCPFVANDQGVRRRYPVRQEPYDPAQECYPEFLGQRADSPYETHYVRDRALEFVRDAEADDSRPWFLYVAPYAPHAPYTPEATYKDAPVPAYTETPATFEADISDKQPSVAAEQVDRADVFGDPDADPPVASLYELSQQTLMSVDDMVERLLEELELRGEQDTIAVFMSDNGYLWGDHGLRGKSAPYNNSIDVPLAWRYAPVTRPGLESPRLTANIDLAPTVLDLLDIDPASPMDGHSIVAAHERNRFLTEWWRGDDLPNQPYPPWASVRTPTYHYIENYASDLTTVVFREFYDLVNDPWELQNLYGGDGDPSNDPPTSPSAATLSAQVAADRLCAGPSCP